MVKLVYCLRYNVYTSKNFPFGEHLTKKNVEMFISGFCVVVISKQVETILEFNNRDTLINVENQCDFIIIKSNGDK